MLNFTTKSKELYYIILPIIYHGIFCIPFELRSSNLHHIHDVQECIHSTQIKALPL